MLIKGLTPPTQVGAALGGNQQEMIQYLFYLWKGDTRRGWDP